MKYFSFIEVHAYIPSFISHVHLSIDSSIFPYLQLCADTVCTYACTSDRNVITSSPGVSYWKLFVTLFSPITFLSCGVCGKRGEERLQADGTHERKEEEEEERDMDG